MKFFESKQCLSRRNCKKCRESLEYRKKLKLIYIDIQNENFECPNKIIKIDRPNYLYSIIILVKTIFSSVFKKNKLCCSRKEFLARRKVCRFCNLYCHVTDICSKCGCVIRLKARIHSEECPNKHW